MLQDKKLLVKLTSGCLMRNTSAFKGGFQQYTKKVKKSDYSVIHFDVGDSLDSGKVR